MCVRHFDRTAKYIQHVGRTTTFRNTPADHFTHSATFLLEPKAEQPWVTTDQNKTKQQTVFELVFTMTVTMWELAYCKIAAVDPTLQC
jgi:hypothetical protein